MASIYLSSNLLKIVPDYFPPGSMSFGPKAHVLLSKGYENLSGYLASFDLNEFKSKSAFFSKAVFYKVKRPFSFGVIHEFWGVQLHLSNNSNPCSVPQVINMVAGLTSESDLEFFNCSLKVLDGKVAHSPYSIAIESCQEFVEVTETVQRLVKKSCYSNWSLYVASMIFTPVFGQPCSNLADSIEYVLRPYVLDEHQFPIWN